MFLNECCISEVPINHIICLLFYNFKKYFKIKTTKFTTRWLENKEKERMFMSCWETIYKVLKMVFGFLSNLEMLRLGEREIASVTRVLIKCITPNSVKFSDKDFFSWESPCSCLETL